MPVFFIKDDSMCCELPLFTAVIHSLLTSKPEQEDVSTLSKIRKEQPTTKKQV